ncbi:hypothetical protein J2X69_003701 [Algoriphagus sp. 4150]|nr:hypothetical protein [Algoriphagus sp. 4150]
MRWNLTAVRQVLKEVGGKTLFREPFQFSGRRLQGRMERVNAKLNSSKISLEPQGFLKS